MKIKMFNVRFYVLAFALTASSFTALKGQKFKTLHDTEGLALLEGKDSILFYQRKSKSMDGKYERANYIHPLYGLNGEVLSEDFPDDHLHHRGIFWAWHQNRIDGKQVADGWAIENMTWDVKGLRAVTSKKKADIHAEVLWKTTADENKGAVDLVLEKTTVTVYPTEKHSRTIDFSISLTALVEGLEIGGSEDVKGYSGFSLRVKLPEDINFTSQGEVLQPKTEAVEGGPWLDMTGTFSPGLPSSGIAVFCHPQYPKKKQPWILRSARSMQNPAFPHTELAKVGTKDPLVLKYRVVIHDNTVGSEALEEMYQTFIK